MEKFKLIIVEDVPLELKGTEGIIRNEIPEAEIIGTAALLVAFLKNDDYDDSDGNNREYNAEHNE